MALYSTATHTSLVMSLSSAAAPEPMVMLSAQFELYKSYEAVLPEGSVPVYIRTPPVRAPGGRATPGGRAGTGQPQGKRGRPALAGASASPTLQPERHIYHGGAMFRLAVAQHRAERPVPDRFQSGGHQLPGPRHRVYELDAALRIHHGDHAHRTMHPSLVHRHGALHRFRQRQRGRHVA